MTLFRITHAAYVLIFSMARSMGCCPLRVNGAIPIEPFDRLQTLGSLVELALWTATAHQRLEDEASSDALTALANGREFERAIARLPIRRAYAFFAADIDSLKAVNDTSGHAAGDELIAAVASVSGHA